MVAVRVVHVLVEQPLRVRRDPVLATAVVRLKGHARVGRGIPWGQWLRHRTFVREGETLRAWLPFARGSCRCVDRCLASLGLVEERDWRVSTRGASALGGRGAIGAETAVVPVPGKSDDENGLGYGLVFDFGVFLVPVLDAQAVLQQAQEVRVGNEPTRVVQLSFVAHCLGEDFQRGKGVAGAEIGKAREFLRFGDQFAGMLHGRSEPPSTLILAPVMYEFAREARQAITTPISSGRPARPR